MSDESELNRLRADLEVIERYEGRMYALAAAKAEIGNKIAELEAAADPWRDAKRFASAYRDPKGSSYLQKLIAHYDHLASEVARLTARVAELEAAAKAEDDADVADAESVLSDPNARYTNFDEAARAAWEKGQDDEIQKIWDDQKPDVPSFSRPIAVDLELDPARVLATAAELGWGPTVYAEITLLRDAKPYPLKKGGE